MDISDEQNNRRSPFENRLFSMTIDSFQDILPMV